MLLPAQPWPQEAERQFLESIRARYEAEGFTFTVAPRGDELPSFLGSYVPDALAKKPGLNIAIEVKRSQSPSTQGTLQKIRRLFEGHDDWQLSVFVIGREPLESVIIPPAMPAAIKERIDEVTALDAGGYRGAAFIMAWSLLEAALHLVGGETKSKALAPGTVVQTLAMNGYIEPSLERRMRSMVELRNRVVHGDLNVEPTSTDIELVLSAIKQTLAANSAA